MSQKSIADLLERYQNDTCTPEEKETVERWFEAQGKARTDFSGMDKEQKAVLIQKLFDRIQATNAANEAQAPQPKKRLQLWARVGIAASVVLALGIGSYIAWQLNGKKAIKSNQAAITADIAPGTDRATLTLSNGQKIVLDKSKAGVLTTEDHTKVLMQAGAVQYASGSAAQGQILYNTLSTARGEQFPLVLPDGSRVWLNAASSLTYPVSFTGQKDRTVTLSGEAYFEVAHNKAQPFKVRTDRQEVTVLGTHFDINSYGDGGVTKTTLLEGSVQLKSLAGKDSCRLAPGQQAVFGHHIKVIPVDADDAVDWKNGYFIFDKETLGEIMLRVSRWYKVDVVYADQAAQDFVMGGIVQRNNNLSAVLHVLSSTGSVHFKLDGSKVIVSL